MTAEDLHRSKEHPWGTGTVLVCWRSRSVASTRGPGVDLLPGHTLRRVRRAIYVAPSGELADPRILAGLAVAAEERSWDGFFVRDLIVYRAGHPASAAARA